MPGGTYYSNVNIDNDAREQHCGKLLFSIYGPTEIFDIVFDDDLWFIIFVSLYAATKILYNYMLLREGVTFFWFRVEYYLKIFKDCEYLEYSSYLYKTHFVCVWGGGEASPLGPLLSNIPTYLSTLVGTYKCQVVSSLLTYHIPYFIICMYST